MTETTRLAVLSGLYDEQNVARYLPSNYSVTRVGPVLIVAGHDEAGWTLDGYVLPRLASGLYVGREYREVTQP